MIDTGGRRRTGPRRRPPAARTGGRTSASPRPRPRRRLGSRVTGHRRDEPTRSTEMNRNRPLASTRVEETPRAARVLARAAGAGPGPAVEEEAEVVLACVALRHRSASTAKPRKSRRRPPRIGRRRPRRCARKSFRALRWACATSAPFPDARRGIWSRHILSLFVHAERTGGGCT